MTRKLALEIGKGTVKEFFEDYALRLAAALAYYAVFSLGPLLFIIVAIAGKVFDEELVRGQVHGQLTAFVGEQAAGTVESMMTARKGGQNLLTSVLAVVMLLLGASGVFGQLQDALNTIWEVTPKPGGKALFKFMRQRFLSMSMVLGMGFLLLISMVISTVLEAILHKGGQLLPVPNAIMAVLSIVISFAVVTLLFAMIFKFLPDVKIKWRDVWVGAIMTALLFTAGRYLISLYLGRPGTASSYGAAGSVLIILLWVYYSSIILFFGAEFTQVYALKTGARVTPASYAEPVTEKARANQGMPRRPDTASAPAPAGARQRRKRPPHGKSTASVLWGVGMVLAGWWLKRKLLRRVPFLRP